MRALCCIATISGPILALLSAASGDEVSFAGTVVRASDGAPIAGAAVGVCLYVGEEYVWLDARTDADGRFELRHDDARSRGRVVAVADGFAIGQAPALQDAPITIRLSDDPDALTGTVLGDGEPVAGAEVAVRAFRIDGQRFLDMVSTFDWAHAPRATTDADGRFELTGLPRGSHVRVHVSAPGWADWYVPSWADRYAVGEHLTARLWPEAAIEGRALLDGQPVAGITVHAESSWYAPLQAGTVTAADGRYRVGALPAGSWHVRAETIGDTCAPRPALVNIASGETARLDIAFQDRAKAPLVRGTVVLGDTGEPAVGAQVAGGPLMFPPQTDQPFWTALTDEQGRYELRLPEGAVAIAYAGNLEGYGPRQTASQYRELLLGPEGMQADFVLDPGPDERGVAEEPAPEPRTTVLCVVTGPDGRPVPGAVVYRTHSDPFGPGVPAQETVADENGQFAVTLSGDAERELLVADREGRLCAYITLSPLVTQFGVRLEPAAWAQARVVDTDGRPVPGIYGVAQRVPDEPQPPGPPGAGDFRVGVSDEQGLVRIGPLPPDMPLRFAPSYPAPSMLVEDTWAALGEVMLAPGQVFELPPLVLNPAGRALTGRLVDGDGDPVAGATVLSTRGVRSGVQTTSGEDGRFRLEGLRTLEWVPVVAFAHDGSLAAGLRCDPDEWPRPARGHPAVDEAEELTVVLRPPAAVEGITRHADGTPLPGMEVNAVTHGITPTVALHPALRIGVTVLSEEAGRWRIEGLIPGLEYLIDARDPLTDDACHPEPTSTAGDEVGEIELIFGRVR